MRPVNPSKLNGGIGVLSAGCRLDGQAGIEPSVENGSALLRTEARTT
jgi:hypothetical protein